jgi:hypothetical protein
MFRASAWFILISFCLWIIPLGAFIRLSDEGKICGGQRAICLCHFAPAKKMDLAKKISVSSNASKEKDSTGGQHFLARFSEAIFSNTKYSFLQQDCFFSSEMFQRNIEHVPKT